MRSCGAAPMLGDAVNSKGPVEADLIDAVCDSRPPNSRHAIRLWHPCVDVYISNPQATVVARSDRNRAGPKPGRVVAEVYARPRGPTAPPVRAPPLCPGSPNRFAT